MLLHWSLSFRLLFYSAADLKWAILNPRRSKKITLHTGPVSFAVVIHACQLATLLLDNGFASIDLVLMASGLQNLLP